MCLGLTIRVEITCRIKSPTFRIRAFCTRQLISTRAVSRGLLTAAVWEHRDRDEHVASRIIGDGVAQEDSADQTTSIGVDALITGRTLHHPIHDEQGVLLLAKDSTITPKFKQLLRSRSISHVIVHCDDAANLTLSPDVVSDPGTSWFDPGLTKQLDNIIESGNLFVANTGKAVSERMVLHGCKAYDPEARDQLLHAHERVSRELDDMMQGALHGESVGGSKLSERTGAYVGALTSDADSVLSIASEIGKDSSLADHCLKSAILAMAVGIELGLDDKNIRDLGLCGLLHDWGMVRVSESLRKSDKILDDGEFIEIKKHPIHTLGMLERVRGIPSIVPLVCYQVHERPNGTGYPRERKQNETHLFARILHVADAFVAMTSERPHRPRVMAYAAMECLIRQAGDKSVDPKVVRALLHVLSLFPVGSYLVLDDGTIGRVLRRNGDNYASPIVQQVSDSEGNQIDTSEESSIIDLATSKLGVVQALPTPGKQEIGLRPEVLVIR